MRPFLICIHDVTPAHDSATRAIIRDLTPLVGRRLSLGVVPNWHGRWPLGAHPDYCRFVRDASDELLLHGYLHQRQRGWGPATLLTEGSDEMNGLDADGTQRALERGQRLFAEVFGEAARGFVSPAWQPGHVRSYLHAGAANTVGLEYVLGFFALDAWTERRVPLATWTWDCGRWRWLGHVGHGIGYLLRSLDRGVPVLAIHPRDLERGFRPTILRLTRELLDAGYEPATVAGLLEATC